MKRIAKLARKDYKMKQDILERLKAALVKAEFWTTGTKRFTLPVECSKVNRSN
jgi:hypothetical protein